MAAVHLLTTFQGTYTAANLLEEVWQFGLRWRISDTGADPIGAIPEDWQPVAATINRDESSWRITGNWSMEGPLGNGFAVDDWLNDQVAPAATTWMANALWSSSCVLSSVSCYPIGSPNGRAVPAPPYAAGSPVTLTWKTPNRPQGTGTGSILPTQIAEVVSLRTQQVGRRGRGRFYCPPLPTSKVTNGMLSSTAPDDIAAFAQGLIDGCTVDDSVPTERHVNLIVTGAPYTQYGLVTEIRVGNVFDTQRRRRKQLTETYVNRPIPAP